MSDIIPRTFFRLEGLPDEILLEIFKYLKPIDLLSFKGHNQRLNHIIRDVKLHIILQYSEEDDEKDLDYFINFSPEQVICLKLHYGWRAFDLNLFQELRSLTLDCTYLSNNQLDQVFSIKLQHLERISIDNVPHDFRKELLLVILDNEHFPSLKICQFTGEFYSCFEIDDHCQLPNNTIRALILSQWYGYQLGPLFNLLPNLHRFETNFDEPFSRSLNLNMPHISLTDLRVTLNDLLNDLDEMLQYTPYLKRLRVKGKISKGSVLEHFEKLAKIIHSHTHILQRFDCELYFHSWNDQVDIIVIQQLHPLFKQIQCLLGKNINRCYATDLTEYPPDSEYAYVERSVNRTTLYSGVMHGYDSDHDYYDDDDDWRIPGLSYRESYKRAFLSSPWSGNNDD
ncbi:unnamed protein product [Rotaria sordida]|uniref:F-box domain-containing protein n=1 Tax=Rotaria sordida TaxID=392033 RepID=A0A819FIX3_9BILA|nr:unnamed protein product [Rotaria sordida]